MGFGKNIKKNFYKLMEFEVMLKE